MQCRLLKIWQTLAASQVFLRWIPTHQGFGGNERSDELAKLGASNNTNSTSINLPVPSRATWNVALRETTNKIADIKWRGVPPSHFNRVWRGFKGPSNGHHDH